MQLFTETDIANLLRLESPDPVRAVRELVRNEGAPYTRVGSKMRFTQAQYETLLELLCRQHSVNSRPAQRNIPAKRASTADQASVEAVRARLREAREEMKRRG